LETKFTKSTDKEHKIKLESSILHALWSSNIAYAGSEAGVEVKTMFVGEGGKINITGKSEKGKNLGKIKDKIYGNGYSGKLKIPDKIKPGDMASFTVKLPQLGLKAESNRIRIVPKIEVSNMQWDKKEARRGDTLKLTADVEGVRDESEVKVIIYEHDSDGNHDKIAELPTKVKNKKVEVFWEYEYHEDTDEIPTEDELQQYNKEKHYEYPEYFFVLKIDDDEYGRDLESGILGFKDWIELTLADEYGDPEANKDYILHLADGSKREGTLDGNGRLREEDVPPGAISVEFISDGESMFFEIQGG
jgi:hypothetical protein